jgi:hypothetical protein
VPADGTSAANWKNGDLGTTRFWAGLDFMDSFSDKRRLPCKAYGYVNIEHNRGDARFGALSRNTWRFISQHLALHLTTRRGSPFVFPATEGT